jgi:hypothetical protein
MPTGSFDYQSQVQLALDAIQITVNKYNSAATGQDGPYTVLPNIRCEQIQYHEGIDPPTARFSYFLDDILAANQGWPSQFEDIWPLATQPSDYVVKMDDELVVLAMIPSNSGSYSAITGQGSQDDPTPRILFHGFARVPQTDVSAQTQHVNFTAAGVAIRCWEAPIGRRLQRDANDPNEGESVSVDLPTRFNPAGTGTRAVNGILPNCTPDGKDEGQDGPEPFPMFLDSSIDRDPDPRTLWNLSKCVRYILKTSNLATDAAGDPIVANPDFGVLDTLLKNRQPLEGASFFDPSDPSTYKDEPNIVRDFDATNKPWPEVVAHLLGFYGFAMRFVCEDGGDQKPYNYLEVYRKDANGPTDPKELHLPRSNTNIVDDQVNVSSFHAGFDFHSVYNDVFVETHVEQWEVSILLAPAFTPTSGDGTVANKTQFLMSSLNDAAATRLTRAKYRQYIADECADGHWSIENNTWVTDQSFEFHPIFPDLDDLPGYVRRYRPGKGTLFSKDLNNKPLKATLSLSRDYGVPGIGGNAPDPPCFWDSVTGTWQDVSPSTWNLMTDRLGIIITCEDVEAWNIGKPPKNKAPNGQPFPAPDGKVRGVSCMADPVGSRPVPDPEGQFWLRLTTVIEADFGIGSNAYRRDASPLKQSVQRRVDATDHFHWDVIDGCSMYSKDLQTPGTAQTKVQDDTDETFAHACQLRSAHEFPPLTAAVTIPALDLSISIGDRVSKINGREVSLLVNAGSESGEAKSYPFVVGLTWDFTGEHQSTVLQLSDRRAEPRRAIA